jgi:hypothetical protein
VRAIAAGEEFSLAVLTNGTVEAWGNNFYGQLGNTSVEETSTVPVPVEGINGATSVAAGAKHALALVGGGAVMAWGEDTYGELGNGTFATQQETPVAVSGVSGATAVSAGGGFSVAILGSGSLVAWGINQSGTLGDASTGSPSATPVAVAGLAKVAAVSAGSRHVVAYGEPQPSVNGVSPGVGPATGGTTVTITGGDLAGATAVHFGSTEAAFTQESPSRIIATAPAGSGTVDITVVTPGGTSFTSAADRFIYQVAPAVATVKPSSGPVGGKNAVTITGSEFTAATAVTFGGEPAASYRVLSATAIEAVAPSHAAGTVNVIVTNTAGSSPVTTKDHYKFTPTIESVSPSEGLAAGGESVTVTGTGFALGSATIIKFGTAKGASVNCTSSTTCTVLTPAHAAGTVSVKATVNAVTSPAAAGAVFTYH